MNVAEQVVEMLADAGVKRIYAVTGDSLNGINDAVRRNGSIEWIQVRHEETGAFAAGAEAQLTGRLACCAGSSGPGHVHLINGVYDAHRTNAPVVVIASCCLSKDFGTKYFQETNTIKLFDDCSYYNQVAVTPYQAPRMLQGAMQAALTLKGVGVFGLPGDLTDNGTEDVFSSTKVYPAPTTACPPIEQLRELAELLNHTEKVCLFCGIGAQEAHEELVELSQRLHAPVAYTFKSKMEIQYANPNEVGMTGLLGMTSGYDSMHEADVLLMLGTDFPYSPFLPEDNKIIQIDIRPNRLGRRAKLHTGICGDVKTTLAALLPLVRQKEDDSFLKKQLSKYEKVKEDLAAYVKVKGTENSIHPEYVMAEVNALADHDAIFTVDTGMTCVWGARYLQATGRRKMIGSFNHGSMANAMPQAIGASLAFPDRQVIALCGDGGLAMLLGDLGTISQYRLPVKIVVFDNCALGMVKLEMEVAGLPDWQTDIVNPDYEYVAKSVGIQGYKVTSPDEVMPTLVRAFGTPGPALIDIHTDPNALAMPPKVEWGQMMGFAKSMTKLMMNGKSQEVIDTINSNFKHLRSLI